MKTDPEFANECLNIAFNYHSELIMEALGAGADVILCGNDIAQTAGLMMSPKDFEKFILPHYQRLVKITKEDGGDFVKHSDANIWQSLPYQ